MSKDPEALYNCYAATHSSANSFLGVFFFKYYYSKSKGFLAAIRCAKNVLNVLSTTTRSINITVCLHLPFWRDSPWCFLLPSLRHVMFARFVIEFNWMQRSGLMQAKYSLGTSRIEKNRTLSSRTHVKLLAVQIEPLGNRLGAFNSRGRKFDCLSEKKP